MKKVKNLFNRIKTSIVDWKNKNPKEFWVLVAVLVLASILRLYKIEQYMTFLGDEGRDVIIVKRLLTEAHPPLIGPGTSIGNMYLGPLYYYMMAPALLLANFSPVGPAVQVAILGVITVFLVWYVAREWFGKTAAFIASLLYAISPTVIIFSRSSWNPNIMPFFSLVCMYSIWKVWKDKRFEWLLLTGISFAFVLQSHYLGLLLFPTIFIYYLFAYKNAKLKSETPKIFRYSLYGYGIFLLLMSPLLFFDLRHDYMNSRAMYQFFSVRQTTVSVKPWSAIPKVPALFVQINQSLVTANDLGLSKKFSLLVIVGVVLLAAKSLKQKKVTEESAPYYFLALWMFFALVGFGVYKQNIYDHYFGFVFVIPFLFAGGFISRLFKSGFILKILGTVFLLILLSVSISKNPLKYSPNKQLERSRDVSQKILEESGGNPFDLAVLAERNYEDGYRYFLQLSGATVLHADRWDPKSIADQLFVVCEMEEKKCDPTHSPKAEVANFGMTKIDKQWSVDGVIIYRLLHTK